MSRPASSWSPMTQLMASTYCSRYLTSAIPDENGRPRRLPSNHDGRGHDPVTVVGSSRSRVAVSIFRLLWWLRAAAGPGAQQVIVAESVDRYRCASAQEIGVVIRRGKERRQG